MKKMNNLICILLFLKGQNKSVSGNLRRLTTHCFNLQLVRKADSTIQKEFNSLLNCLEE